MYTIYISGDTVLLTLTDLWFRILLLYDKYRNIHLCTGHCYASRLEFGTHFFLPCWAHMTLKAWSCSQPVLMYG